MLPFGRTAARIIWVLNNGGKLVRTADGAVLSNTLVDADAARTLAQRCLQED